MFWILTIFKRQNFVFLFVVVHKYGVITVETVYWLYVKGLYTTELIWINGTGLYEPYVRASPRVRTDFPMREISPLVRPISLSQTAWDGFCESHYIYYVVRTQSLATKFWNKNQQTMEYYFRTRYLRWKKLSILEFVFNTAVVLLNPIWGTRTLPTVYMEISISALLREISPSYHVNVNFFNNNFK